MKHRDAVDLGCPSAALIDEIVRGGPAVRVAYDDGLTAIVEAMASRLEGESELHGESLRLQVMSAYALMIGTMQMARSLVDDTRSREVLARGIDNVLALLT